MSSTSIPAAPIRAPMCRLYTLCVRDNAVQSSGNSHLISSRPGDRRDGHHAAGLRLSHRSAGPTSAWKTARPFAGMGHFAFIDADFVGDHLTAAYIIPHQHEHQGTAFLISNNGDKSAQLLPIASSPTSRFSADFATSAPSTAPAKPPAPS